MERQDLIDSIEWAAERVSTEVLLRVYKIMCRNVMIRKGVENEEQNFQQNKAAALMEDTGNP